MRKILFPIGIIICSLALLLLLVLGGAFKGAASTANAITQKEAETLAISYAKTEGFQGEPTSVQSKLVSQDEIKTLLGSFRANTDSEWLVVLKGKALVNMAPSMNSPSQQLFDNMYVELSIKGELLGTGSRNPGYEINLK